MDAIRDLMLAAFGAGEGPTIARLIAELLVDHSAEPRLSLVATIGQQLVGHVLFSHARVCEADTDVPAAILAPLAVLPEFQSKGIGGQLITAGLEGTARQGAELVFVLGHPHYYPRYGFQAAGALGLEAPYPIAAEHADAWMVQALQADFLGSVHGTVSCAAALRDPDYWLE
jgi:predicted N-acetyltransferase YhbS